VSFYLSSTKSIFTSHRINGSSFFRITYNLSKLGRNTVTGFTFMFFFCRERGDKKVPKRNENVAFSKGALLEKGVPSW
jgi:hypothetical protein